MAESLVLSVLNQLAEKHGIKVFIWDFPQSINGLYYRSEQKDYIGLNKSLSGGDLNRVFAHELGHYHLHRDEGNLINGYLSGASDLDRRKVAKVEKQADAFAEMLVEAIKLALVEARHNAQNHPDPDPPPTSSAMPLAA